MKHGSLLLLFIIPLSCNTVRSQVLEQLHNSVDSTSMVGEQELLMGAVSSSKDGQDVPLVPSNILGYRYPQVPLEVDGYTIAPDNLQLEQVHIYVRHGERTPVKANLDNPPASIPRHWAICRMSRHFRTTMLSVSSDNTPIPKEPDHIDQTQHSRTLVELDTATEGECLPGQLTDLGRQSTFHFGHNLRKLYIDRLGFLPETLQNDKCVYFRSTNMRRTIESLQEIIHGLYPINKRHYTVVPSLLIRSKKDENLISNTRSCERLKMGFAKATAEAYDPTLEHLDKKVSKYIGGKPIRINGEPRAYDIFDTIRAAVAHGIKVPPEFEDNSVINPIEKALINNWFAGKDVRSSSIDMNDQFKLETDKTEQVRRLGMGRLLEDLSRKMQQKALHGSQDPLKILVHSTHDVTLAGLCSTLDVFDDRWPAFTASIAFELYKKTGSPSQCSSYVQSIFSPFGISPAYPQHYVRMRYQNKNMVLPFCAQVGNHLEGYPEFCTLAAFRSRVKELTPIDWDKECSSIGRA